MHNIYLYILITGLVSYLIRILPLTFIRKPITSPFLKSFLYYVPYVTLTIMTFPAILNTTGHLISGIGALCIGVLLSYNGKSLLLTAAFCCITVLLIETILF